jgi:hypothetical protein
MKEATIYADTTFSRGSELELSGSRLPFFYLHGQAQDVTGYDCCNGNIEAFRYALSFNHFFLADLTFEHTDIPTQRCICFTKTDVGRIAGRIILINDKAAIEQCERWLTLNGYEHHINELKEKYPETYELIKKISKDE